MADEHEPAAGRRRGDGRRRGEGGRRGESRRTRDGRPGDGRSTPTLPGYGPSFHGRRATPSRPRLSLDEIVAAAVRILDAEGADALTFRRLAQELEAGVASLYWHVESKDVLLDLALDAVLDEVRLTPRRRNEPWPDELRRSGISFYRVLLAHRWAAAQMVLSTGGVGPNTLRLWEHVASTLNDAGFTRQQAFDAVAVLMNHVLASANQEASWDPTGTMSAADRRRQLRQVADGLRALDPAVFPAVVASADIFESHDQAVQFADLLDVILAGLQASYRIGEPS